MAVQPNTSAVDTLPPDAVSASTLPPDALGGDSVAAKAHATWLKNQGPNPFNKPSTPGFLESARRSFGIPSTVAELKGMLPGLAASSLFPMIGGAAVDTANTIGGLSRAHNVAQAGQALSPSTAMFGQQVGEGNLSGAAGTASPLIAQLAAGALGKFLPEPSSPITGIPIYGNEPTLGASIAKSIPMPRWLPQGIQDWMVNAKKPVGYNMLQGEYGPSAPPPTPTALETLSATNINDLPSIPGATRPPRPASPTPVSKPSFELGSVPTGRPTIPVDQPVGPPQPFNTLPNSVQKLFEGIAPEAEGGSATPPRKVSAVQPNNTKGNYSGITPSGLETAPLPANFTEAFVTPEQASPGQVLSFDTKTGMMTKVIRVSEDGRSATVEDTGPGGVFSRKEYPVRSPYKGKLDFSKAIMKGVPEK